jgi:LPXTG-motif cell wall-anchored protein
LNNKNRCLFKVYNKKNYKTFHFIGVNMIFNPKVFISGFLLLITLSACSISGDVTPPPSISATQDPPPGLATFTPQPVIVKGPEITPDTAPINVTPQIEDTGNLAGSLTISGQVLTASGLPLDEFLVVNLQGYEDMKPVLNTTTDVDAEGQFRFEGLETSENQVYIASTRYRGNDFTSNVIHPSDIQNNEMSGITITVFDAISDTSNLVADRAHVFLDFNKPGQLQVAVLMIVSNMGQQIVSPQDGKPPLTFELPSDATNLQFDEGSLGDRFVKTDQGFADLEPIYPGLRQHEILFAYDVPYERKQSLTLKFPLAVDAAIIALPMIGVRLQSEQLQETSQRDIEGSTFKFYEAKKLAAESPLTLKLSGRIGSTGDNNNLVIGIAVLALVLVVIGLWIWRKRKNANISPGSIPQNVENENEDSLLDAIVALDDVFRSGGLPEEAYRQRRAELKDRLKAIKNLS